MASERERSAQRHDLIRKGNTEFLIRKKNIQTSVSMRSKHNYYSKISQELTIIKQYEVPSPPRRTSWLKSTTSPPYNSPPSPTTPPSTPSALSTTHNPS
jgi:hypothetical protein